MSKTTPTPDSDDVPESPSETDFVCPSCDRTMVAETITNPITGSVWHKFVCTHGKKSDEDSFRKSIPDSLLSVSAFSPPTR